MLEWKRSEPRLDVDIEERASGDGVTPAESTAYADYVAWSKENGHRQMSSNKFGMRMTALGKGSRKTAAGNVYPFKLDEHAQGCRCERCR